MKQKKQTVSLQNIRFVYDRNPLNAASATEVGAVHGLTSTSSRNKEGFQEAIRQDNWRKPSITRDGTPQR